MHIKKTIILTGLIGATVGLVGCSNSGSTDIKQKDSVDTSGLEQENQEQIQSKVNYINKSGLDFESYYYADDTTGLKIKYELLTEGKKDLTLSFPILNRGTEEYKEHIKTALTCLGGSKSDLSEINKIVDKFFTDKYLKDDDILSNIDEEGDFYKNIIKNSNYEVYLSGTNVFNYDGEIQIIFSTNKTTNYLKESGVAFQDAYYTNSETELSIAQYTFNNSLDIEFEIPLKHINNTEFTNQLEIAIKAIGGDNKDIKEISEKLNNIVPKDFKEFIIEKDDYSICMDINEYDEDVTHLTVELSTNPINNALDEFIDLELDFDTDSNDNLIINLR